MTTVLFQTSKWATETWKQMARNFRALFMGVEPPRMVETISDADYPNAARGSVPWSGPPDQHETVS